MHRIVLLGPPGSGKSTQGDHLAERWNAPHIATGEILRHIVATEKSELAEAARIINDGKMVSDETINAIVFRELAKPEAAQGFILDGYPRTVAQAEALQGHLDGQGLRLSGVVALQIGEDMVRKRLEQRRREEATPREDDDPAHVPTRFALYHEKTEPLIAYYRERGLLKAVDAAGDEASVTQAIVAALGD